MCRRVRAGWIVPIALIGLVLAGCGSISRRSAGPKPKAEAQVLKPGAMADVLVSLGRNFEEQGDAEKAIGAYREAVRQESRRSDAALRLAVLLDRAGRFAESAPYYEMALKASPGNPEIYCDRGYSLALQGKDTEAEAMFRQAIAKQPDLARAHNNLGLLLGRTDHPHEALAEFRKAGVAESDAHLNLAFALSLNHKFEDARKQIAEAQAVGPGSPQLAEAAQEIETMIARAESSPVDPAIQQAGATRP